MVGKYGIAYQGRPSWRRNPHSTSENGTEVFFLREGAALEREPERALDTGAQGRYQEVHTRGGMRNAKH